MEQYEKLPNFFIIGVPKAGTTSLYKYMLCNDHVYFPQIKEPHFFSAKYLKGKAPHCIDNWNDYKELFSGAGDCKIIGEASVFYFYFYEYSISKIKQKLGSDVSIVLIIRNPVERAFSAYKYALSLNKSENLTFRRALDAEESRIAENKVSPMLHYVNCGMYAERIARWKEAFRNFKVVIFDDLVDNPVKVVNEIFYFLGIENNGQFDFSKKYNTSFGGEWKNPLLGKFVKILVSRSIRDLGHKMFPTGYQFFKKRFLEAAMKESLLCQDDKNHLHKIFSNDIERTSKIIHRDLSSWL